MSENYNEKQTADMVERYKAADTDEARAAVVTELADEFGKSVASIRGKLVREGVYKAKARGKANGRKTKADLVAEVAEATGLDAETLESLVNAKTETLEALVEAIG